MLFFFTSRSAVRRLQLRRQSKQLDGLAPTDGGPPRREASRAAQLVRRANRVPVPAAEPERVELADLLANGLLVCVWGARASVRRTSRQGQWGWGSRSPPRTARTARGSSARTARGSSARTARGSSAYDGDAHAEVGQIYNGRETRRTKHANSIALARRLGGPRYRSASG